jgi:hypothetical protein
MLKFREFLRQRRRKTTTSKGEDEFGHQSLEPDNQFRASDSRVLIGTDNGRLPPAVIPPTIGNAD